jgi:hypothetical protein
MCLAFSIGWHDKATSQKFEVRGPVGASKAAIPRLHSKGTAILKTSVFAFGGCGLVVLGAELDATTHVTLGLETPKNGESHQERCAG